MEWLITVIVIVLIVAIVWWLLSRNSARSSPGGMAPSAPSSASSPQVEAAAAALTGSAPLVAATATAEQVAAETQPTEPEAEPEPEPEPEPGGVDVDDWERPTPPAVPVAEPASEPVAEPPAAPVAAPVAEPASEPEAPVVEEPTLAEPVLSESVAEDAEWGLEEPELEEGVTADDVATADAGPSATVESAGASGPATPEQQADSAEWEATWSEGGASAVPAPIHHREYTDAHAPTLPGAESAAAELVDPGTEARQEAPDDGGAPAAASAPAVEPADAAPLGGHLAADQPYGEGSAAAASDGSGPEGYTVKGNADTMIYHDEDSPAYGEVQADVWFISSAHAEAAGFRPPRRNRR